MKLALIHRTISTMTFLLALLGAVTRGANADVHSSISDVELNDISTPIKKHDHVRKELGSIDHATRSNHRNLLLLKKKSVAIESPLNGAIFHSASGTMDVAVAFQGGSGVFGKISAIDLLVDSKVIATNQIKPTKSGKETFSVDMAGMANGLHQLQARGHSESALGLFRGVFGRRRKSVQSKVISITIGSSGSGKPTLAPALPPNAAPIPAPIVPSPANAPTEADPNTGPIAPFKAPFKAPVTAPLVAPVRTPFNAPVQSPASAPFDAPAKAPLNAPSKDPPTIANINVTACQRNTSFLYFAGHDEAASAEAGIVSLTWSPAFAFGRQDANFLWCGNLSYDIFYIKEAAFNFSGLNVTVPELVKSANKDSSSTPSDIRHIETSALSADLRNLEPGAHYSILITAKTALGHFSNNREAAQVKVATISPVVKSNFTRLVVIPPPNDTFSIANSDYKQYVVFSGDLPPEVLVLKPLDFIQFVDRDGNGTMVQLLDQLDDIFEGPAWVYSIAELGDIFNELDLSGEIAPPANGDLIGADGSLGNVSNATLSEDEWTALDFNIKQNLCIAANRGKDADYCTTPSNLHSERHRALAFVEGWLGPKNRFLDINLAALLYNSEYGTTIGMGFRARSWCRYNITYSDKDGIHSSGLLLMGHFYFEAHLKFEKSMRAHIRPAILPLSEQSFDYPKDLSSRYTVMAGSVPVVIAAKAVVTGFAEVAVTTEGLAQVPLSSGYNFQFEYWQDRFRPETFRQKVAFYKRDVPGATIRSLIDRRMNLEAEVGVQMGWAVAIANGLRANIGFDLGVKANVEVGATVDSMAVANLESYPFPYTLDRYDVEEFTRASSSLWVDYAYLLRPAMTAAGDVPMTFRARGYYSIQQVPWEFYPSVLTDSLKNGLAQAKTDPSLKDANYIDLTQISALVPDPYKATRASIQGIDRNFGTSLLPVNYVVGNSMLITLPTIELDLVGTPQLCTESDAIKFTMAASISNPNMLATTDLWLSLTEWFANFDGKVFTEDTQWKMTRVTPYNVTLRLPRAAVSSPGFALYEIHGWAMLYMRTRLNVFPGYGMLSRSRLSVDVKTPKFECCSNADCVTQLKSALDGTGICGLDRMCVLDSRFTASPVSIKTKQARFVTLTVNLANMNRANIPSIVSFNVRRVDMDGNIVSTVLATLNDTGSGLGSDTVAGDFIFSNTFVLTSNVPEVFILRAYPVYLYPNFSPVPYEPEESRFTLTNVKAVQSFN